MVKATGDWCGLEKEKVAPEIGWVGRGADEVVAALVRDFAIALVKDGISEVAEIFHAESFFRMLFMKGRRTINPEGRGF